MEVTSPLLFAHASMSGAANTNLQSLDLDFSVRAPFGIMINRAAISIGIAQTAVTQGIEIDGALWLSPSEPDDDGIDALSLNPSTGSNVDLNSNIVVGGRLYTTATNNTVDTTNKPPQLVALPVEYADFGYLPPSQRPLTVRPFLLIGRQRTQAGISAQTYAVSVDISYQTVRLDEDELVGIVASR